MAVISWNGASNLDLKILGQSFDFRSDVLQVSDPSLQANQFDLVENGTDLVLVKSRDATGAPLAAADVRYAYIPNMLIRQIGGTDSSPVSSNIVLSNGGQLWVGDRLTDTLLDDAGNDATALSTQLQSVQVWGLGGADTITTGDGNDRVYGNTGADVIDGGAGNDSIYGGQDNDKVSGGSGNDQVAGDAGNDTIDGGSGNDVLYGGAGDDVIDPNTGNDTIFAGNGEDTVALGNSDTGDKLIYMDKGQDEVSIISTTGNHTVYLGDNNDYAELIGNSGNIVVLGDGGNDWIWAQNSGADTLDGGEDDDVLGIMIGSIGQKTLIGGHGNDEIAILDTSGNALAQILPNTQVTVSGGSGDDGIYYARSLFITDANDGGAGDDTLDIDGRTILFARDKSFENIETVNFNGTGGPVMFEGHWFDGNAVVFADGNNIKTVNGSYGEDFFDASAESSAAYTINGNGGNDYIIGGSGNDTINGGVGKDTLDGGDGDDVYVITTPSHGHDHITLEPGEDTIKFGGPGFDGMSSIVASKTNTLVATGSDVNFYILTGEDYTNVADVFQNFFGGTLGTDLGTKNYTSDNFDRPIFFLFYDENDGPGGRAEVWWVDHTEHWEGTTGTGADDARLIAVLDNFNGGNSSFGALGLDQFQIL